MEPNEPTASEELSESNDSNSSITGSCHSEPLTSFQPYRRLDSKPDDETRFADGNDMPIALDKPKDYAIHRNEVYSESSSAEAEPSASIFVGSVGSNKDQLPAQKEAMYTFCREIREMRQKSLHAVLERTAAAVAGSNNNNKNYGSRAALPLERVKDFGFASRMALDRLRAAPIHGETTPSSEPEEPKNLSQLQSRTSSEAMTFERLRHAHQSSLFQQPPSESHFSQTHSPPAVQQPQTALPPLPPPPPSHHHHHNPYHHHHHAITQITQMQQQQQQQLGSSIHQHQQHQQPLHHHQHQPQPHHHHPNQQQQPKSFTIDAILGLRAGTQRDKHQRYHPYKKHQQQAQENTAKSLTASSCSNGNGADSGNRSGGKLKRVRTIFTAEQLERLEDEFTRQQYMVGPERLYLAHALRLTEAQVKVWFQNRRIKWRKHNHEQTSQRLHELHQHSMSEREDSNENAPEW